MITGFYKTIPKDKEDELYTLRTSYLSHIIGDAIWVEDITLRWSNDPFKETLGKVIKKHLESLLTKNIISQTQIEEFKLNNYDEKIDLFDTDYRIYYKYDLVIMYAPDGVTIWDISKILGGKEKW